MRRRASLAVGAGLCVIALGLASVACSNRAGDCALNAEKQRPDGTCVEGIGTGGAKPACSGDPTAKNVIDACGVFAQSDATGTTEDGTQAHPYKTLQKALDSAGTKRVYACASAPFVEAVTIAASVEMYGGFDCAKGWAWSQDKRSTLNGPANTVALTLAKGADGAKVEGFSITGASPSVMTSGGSSIAVAVDDVTATLERCDVKASDAADGSDGQKPPGAATQGAAALIGAMGATNACFAAAVGGPPGMTTCDDGMTSGGVGGAGGVTGTNSGDGQNGADGQPADATKGKGGTGADANNDCNDATKGKSGTAGSAGPGGSAPGLLTLSGITSTDSTDGLPGTKAQGGGGGGGAKSGTFCMAGAMTVDGVGASGGGGGGGGCGGKGGGGGRAGGSSIAIVSLGTKLVLTDVALAVGKGGKGGGGVTGQIGGLPGVGANGGASSGTPPSKAGCKGGDGGTGGDGGPGGGGRGGHSIGVAYAKGPTTAPTVKTFMPGTPGNGGTAGTGAPVTSTGAKGAAAQCWDFGSNAACK